MTLSLHNLKSAGKDRKRVGRGGARGGTSGKGHKGQKARSGGYVRIGFEGGQMPLYRRLPKRGFNNKQFKKEVFIINIDLLEQAFQSGDVVTHELLFEKGLLKGNKSVLGSGRVLLKVLGNGTLTKSLVIHAHAFSKSAMEAIQKSGGEVQLIKEM